MVTISRNGVTLSKNAVENGARMPVHSSTVRPRPDLGDFANREEGRARREARRSRKAERAFFARA